MEILVYDPAMCSEVAKAYNAAIQGVPHCYPVSVEEFASAVAPAIEAVQRHDRLHAEAALVAREGASIRGFIHLATERPKEAGQHEQGVIRFFWYERGHRTAGQALLTAAEDNLRQRDVSRVKAFHQDYRYPIYHLRNAYLSEHLGHVEALLGWNGYQRVGGEVFLDWLNYEPVTPLPVDVAAEISVHWEQGRGTRPGVSVRARQGEKRLGDCDCVSGGEFSRVDDAQDWASTIWLGVSEEVWGKGLGRHLLRRALQEMHGAGYQHAIISTAWDNYRAFLFYSNFGYRVVDWTYDLRRDLSPSPEKV